MLPQIHKVWRAEEISLYWLGFLGLGQVFWLIYGIYMGSTPIVATVAATLIIAAILTALVFINDKVNVRF